MYKLIMMTLVCASLSAAYYDDKSAAGEHSKPVLPPVFRQAPPVVAHPPTAKERKERSVREAVADCKVQVNYEAIFFKENLCNDGMVNCESESYFGGVRVGIERFKKSSVYGRINWMVVPDQMHRNYATHWWKEEAVSPTEIKLKEKLALGHVDAELGYAFKIAGTSRCTLTPFIGTGRYHFMFKTRTHDTLTDTNPFTGERFYTTSYDRDDWPYVSLGARADYWGEVFSIGLKYKQMRAYRVESIIPASWENPRRIRQHPDFESYEVSLPMSVRFGASRWGMTYEPYLVKFGSTNVPRMLGNRLSIDFKF